MSHTAIVTVHVAAAKIACGRYFVRILILHRNLPLPAAIQRSSRNLVIQLMIMLMLDHRKKLKILLLLLRNFFDGVGPEVEALDSLSFSSSLLIFRFSMLLVISAQGAGARNVVAVDA
jgi:hypothetical protein